MRAHVEGDSQADLPAEYCRLKTAVDDFIERGGYLQAGLSIAPMASQLGAQEHQLRRLINQQLGLQNFSGFLNQLRIQQARQWLAYPGLASTPTMKLALDLGYGSVGPFNRAFNHDTGLTPTQSQAQVLDEFSRDFRRAWHRQDAQAVAALYSRDVEWINAFGRTFRGRENLQASLETVL